MEWVLIGLGAFSLVIYWWMMDDYKKGVEKSYERRAQSIAGGGSEEEYMIACLSEPSKPTLWLVLGLVFLIGGIVWLILG